MGNGRHLNAIINFVYTIKNILFRNSYNQVDMSAELSINISFICSTDPNPLSPSVEYTLLLTKF